MPRTRHALGRCSLSILWKRIGEVAYNRIEHKRKGLAVSRCSTRNRRIWCKPSSFKLNYFPFLLLCESQQSTYERSENSSPGQLLSPYIMKHAWPF
eukprot:763613-Hanusia_phi.AAC.2